MKKERTFQTAESASVHILRRISKAIMVKIKQEASVAVAGE